MNLDKLKSICEAATPAKQWVELHTVEADDAEEETVLKFIATFNPATIAKILAVVEAAQESIKRMDEASYREMLRGEGKHNMLKALDALENDK